MELEHALVLEQESHAAAVTQRTAATTEVHADIGHRAVGVVRRRFHHDRNAVRAVSFVDHLLVVGRILLRGTLDRTFDILLGHVLRFGVLNQDAQAGVGGRIGTRRLDGYFDLLADLGKHPGHVPPTLQLARLAIFKRSSHSFLYFFNYSTTLTPTPETSSGTGARRKIKKNNSYFTRNIQKCLTLPKVFAARGPAGSPDATACLNVRFRDRKSGSRRRLRERSETDFPPASPQTEDANRPYDHDPEP